jgi:phenylpyruvate tautomerase PptA (4-oxalocrotonate tautomerase family)
MVLSTTSLRTMPNILIKVPKGAFPPDARPHLLRSVTEAAASAEQIPDRPEARFTSWGCIEELEPGMLTCAGVDMTDGVLPCIAIVCVPSGVLADDSRGQYHTLIHNAFKDSLPSDECRQLVTSVILHDVPDGAWGGNGTTLRLADLAKMAGYAHLQHRSAKRL